MGVPPAGDADDAVAIRQPAVGQHQPYVFANWTQLEPDLRMRVRVLTSDLAPAVGQEMRRVALENASVHPGSVRLGSVFRRRRVVVLRERGVLEQVLHAATRSQLHLPRGK